jgi:tRNA nucleotidyltransferase (CCA-adding enzyme)
MTHSIKAYLVGGAVRDELLGISLDQIKEKDWVVLGETPESMKALGFQQVGKDFPVFLHPKTHEEYALARTERKVAQGHQGFQCFFDPSVTLEEDLLRRDLSINAIAKDLDTLSYIDPFNGMADIHSRVLRHVSTAFAEDPLRVLRVARFLAQLSPFNFKIAPETLTLMKKMVQSGELNHLSGERIFREITKVLQSPAPELFFQCLKEIDAIKIISREPLQVPHSLNPTQSVKPQLGVSRTNLFIKALNTDPSFPPRETDFAAEGQCKIREGNLNPSNISFSLMQKFCWFFYKNIKNLTFTAPTEFTEFGKLIEKSLTLNLYRIEKNPEKLSEVLDQLDVLRRPERFQAFGEFFTALTQDPKPKEFLDHAAKALKELNFKKILEKSPVPANGLLAKELIQLAKKNALKAMLRDQKRDAKTPKRPFVS